MKLIKTTLLLTTLLSLSNANSTLNGEELFKTKCTACHMMSHPSDMSKLVAPPVMGVMRHVKMKHSDKAEAVAFIKDYALNPEASKALCMPQKIKRFGLMPSQKGSVTEKELEAIATYMFENFPSKNFKGMGEHKGNGKNCQASHGSEAKKFSPKPYFLISKSLPFALGLALKHPMKDTLNITPKQKEELMKIAKGSKPAINKKAQQIKALEAELKEAILTKGADPKALFAKVDEISKLRTELTKAHLECIVEVRAIVTDEQWEKMMKFSNKGKKENSLKK